MQRSWGGRQRSVGVAVALACALLGAACTRETVRQADGGAASHVVLVVVDTLRRDALGCYGNPRPVTPRIDALAAEGVRFERAVSTSGWTLPAVGSLLTGTWPMVHGGLGKNTRLMPIRDEVPTAAEVLREAGFRTVGLANAAFLSPLLGLDRGFAVFDHRHATNHEIRRADETIDAAIERLQEQPDRSTFTLIHLFDPHLDYDPPAGYRTRFTDGRSEPATPLTMQLCRAAAVAGRDGLPDPRDAAYVEAVYFGEVAFVDAQVGRLVDTLRELGVWDRTTLILTADHGEEFWDHGGFEHGHTLYDELVLVPLIVKPPRSATVSRTTVDAQVRIVDVLPTVFELAGVEQPDSFVGRSLLPLMVGEETEDRVAFSEGTLYGADKLAWSTSGYKLIVGADAGGARRVELYDWRADPAERRDLAPSRPELARRLLQELDDFVEPLARQVQSMPPGEPVSLSPAEVQRLRSLGYIR